MKLGFKEQITFFVVFLVAGFLVMYATCETFPKVEGHGILLGK